jgi:hypothetical protein
MSSGSSLTSKLYDKIIKMLSKSHETIPLTSRTFSFTDCRLNSIAGSKPQGIVSLLQILLEENETQMLKLIFVILVCWLYFISSILSKYFISVSPFENFGFCF